MQTSYVKHRAFVVLVALVVGLLHLVTGPGYRGPFPAFVNGYLIDILLPTSMYLLLGLFQHSAVQRPVVRGTAVFAVGATTETLQYFGIPLFGRTYRTRQEAASDLFYYIEAFHNRRRLHSTLGYVSPETYEENYHQAVNVA